MHTHTHIYTHNLLLSLSPSLSFTASPFPTSPSISSEFLALMKKVAKSPLVMDILNIPGVQKSLERLADLLGKIQKALGEYLERERASFPR